MKKPPSVVCDSISAEDKKLIVYTLRIDNGPIMQKKFEEYEKFYLKIKDNLPATNATPPKKRFMQPDSRLIEKRKQWITALAQTILMSHPSHELVRDFFALAQPEENDETHVDLGPSEVKTAQPGDFDIIITIGKGSFGRVFQVRHKASGKIYAMKVLSKEHIRKKNEVKHVMAELSVLKANINHPFLVSLHFSFQNKEKLYFILDNINGGELFSHLQKEKHFTEARSRFYAADIASALGYLHEKNIIYRDLKPENLLLDKFGYIVLTDFGLCKESVGPKDLVHTFCGTPEYLAPEIVLKKPYDRTVDWWCLGSVLFEMLFGLPPFYSKDHSEMYDKIVNQPLRMKHSISPASSDIIQQLLQKDRNKRLGAKNDFEEVKKHPFFLPIDFEKLLRREIKPPFVPKVKNETDVSNIDKTFVEDKFNAGSIIPSHMAKSQDHDFPNFTYVETSMLSSHRS